MAPHQLCDRRGDKNGVLSNLMNTMTSRQPLTGAQRRARFLLAAWNSGELSRVRKALEQYREGDSPASGQEREELVDAAAETIRAWLNQPRTCPEADLQAGLHLLGHLASGNPAVGWTPGSRRATVGHARPHRPLLHLENQPSVF